MSEQILLRVVAKMLIPGILVFGICVVTHGELGPGGGFQGGVILAAAFILYGLIFGADQLRERIPPAVVQSSMALGVLLYSGTGLWSLLKGANFLDYSALDPEHPGDAEALGMFLVESGVAITVASVMVTIYTCVARTRQDLADDLAPAPSTVERSASTKQEEPR